MLLSKNVDFFGLHQQIPHVAHASVSRAINTNNAAGIYLVSWSRCNALRLS